MSSKSDGVICCNEEEYMEKPPAPKDRERLLHPLELNDKATFENIKTVKLGFIEKATPPIQRCQDLPSHAFGRLTGRSILVFISHQWLFQTHPDPFGATLNLVKNEFAPKLRERFPSTDIQMFYDFMSLPQNPRNNDEEEETYLAGANTTHSVIIYSDVILFLDAEFPDVDMTLHKATVEISKYKFCDYMCSVQVLETLSKTGPQSLDCILSIGKVKVQKWTDISKYTGSHTLTYLRQPFGRPNVTPIKKRGWHYLEYIVTAVKVAAAVATKSGFECIVMSNSESVTKELLVLSDHLRDVATGKESESLRDRLSEFDSELQRKTFSSRSDKITVKNIMSKMIHQFADDWKGEVEKQKSMSKRAREILLRWGCFSDDFVRRAELLCDIKHKKRMSALGLAGRIIMFSVLAPTLSLIPFSFSLERDGGDPSLTETSITTSLWLGCVFSFIFIKVQHLQTYTFAKIPIGVHTLRHFVVIAVLAFVASLSLRLNFFLPFHGLIVLVIAGISGILLLRTKLIPIQHKNTGKTNRWELISWLVLPSTHRFDLKSRKDIEACKETAQVGVVFGAAYPILGSLFFQSNLLVQALLIPVFFIIRTAFEARTEFLITRKFGSDGLIVVNFSGVLLHEACLSVMITSIKHPLIFVSLVLMDVLENSFCLWSLLRVSKKSKRIVPSDKVAQSLKDDDDEDDRSCNNSALFIAATLLQREMIEAFVPIQAAIILSILHKIDVKSNTVVHGWSEDDWSQTMKYMAIDLLVELVVFAVTILVFHKIYPQFNAFRILRGLISMHWISMTVSAFATWVVMLLFQSTYFGVDLSLDFSWLSCQDKSNSTWLGGFEWECADNG